MEVPDVLYDRAGLEWHDVPGTLHAAEHTGIAMLPLFAICDRWDVGGLSTALHPGLGRGIWRIYDGYAGGCCRYFSNRLRADRGAAAQHAGRAAPLPMRVGLPIVLLAAKVRELQ